MEQASTSRRWGVGTNQSGGASCHANTVRKHPPKLRRSCTSARKERCAVAGRGRKLPAASKPLRLACPKHAGPARRCRRKRPAAERKQPKRNNRISQMTSGHGRRSNQVAAVAEVTFGVRTNNTVLSVKYANAAKA